MLPTPTLTSPRDALPPDVSLSRHARAAHRLRLSVPGLLGDPVLARRLEETLSHYPGVRSASASTRSGRILIIYEEAPALLAALPQQHAYRAAVGAPQAQAKALAHAKTRNRSRAAERGQERSGASQSLPPFHALQIDEVLRLLDASPEGLDPAEAARRQAEVGLNLPEPEEARSHLQILAAQLAGIPTGILLGASALSLALGDFTEAAAILAVVTLNAAIGYRIERKNEDLLASWRKMEAGEVQVLRGGDLRAVPSFDLVPGDVLLCRGGDMVPADARVLDAHRLSCDEAPLTGESEPARKVAAPVAKEAPLAERSCMLYAGTAVASGHCRAVVTAIGPQTELAQVQRLLLRERAPRAPLELRLNELGNRAAALGIAASVAAGAVSLLRRRPAAQVLRTAVALGVAALPEGLPVVATAALVRCMHRMRERQMVVRRLAAAETLGGVTVICADKTGTLTQNEMRLQVLDLGEGSLDPATIRARPGEVLTHPPTLALAAAVLNSDVDVHMNGNGLAVSGSATERALVTAAHRAGLESDALRATFPRLLLRERSEGVHYVVSLHRQARGPLLAFVKGAPEQVRTLCDRGLRGPLGEEARRRLLRRNDEMAERGLRVLALGFRTLPAKGHAGDTAGVAQVPRSGFTLIGLLGLRDPLREGAGRAIHDAACAGIRTLILTGDQRRTAQAVAAEVGLRGVALDGAEVTRRLALQGRGDPNDSGGPDGLEDLAVLSRVTPADKLAIVRALREQGHVVAMAGDGINDAPALKVADVGIAVGRGASDLARQVADVVLAGEDLHSILVAVAEGRIVQDNLRRALRFLFATNLSEMALVLGAAVVGAREPLTPLQLLWINLLTDTLPALALALTPGDPDVLDRGPAPPGAPLLDSRAWRKVVRDGLLLSGVGTAGLVLGGGPMAFSTLTAAQIGYTGVCQAATAVPDQRYFNLVGAAAGLQLVALLAPWPFLRTALGIPAGVGLPMLGFAGGFLLPWLASKLAGGETIVRRNPALQPEVNRRLA